MAGTKAGGEAASLTNRQLYGDDFYRRIGKMGGESSRGGGFSSEFVRADGMTGPELASIAGKKGGRPRKKRD